MTKVREPSSVVEMAELCRNANQRIVDTKVIDEEIQDEIMDYFRSAETDSINAAIAELGDDEIGETELRLMRIRFISEVGN